MHPRAAPEVMHDPPTRAIYRIPRAIQSRGANGVGLRVRGTRSRRGSRPGAAGRRRGARSREEGRPQATRRTGVPPGSAGGRRRDLPPDVRGAAEPGRASGCGGPQRADPVEVDAVTPGARGAGGGRAGPGREGGVDRRALVILGLFADAAGMPAVRTVAYGRTDRPRSAHREPSRDGAPGGTAGGGPLAVRPASFRPAGRPRGGSRRNAGWLPIITPVSSAPSPAGPWTAAPPVREPPRTAGRPRGGMLPKCNIIQQNCSAGSGGGYTSGVGHHVGSRACNPSR